MKDNAHILTQLTRHGLILVPRAKDKKPLVKNWSSVFYHPQCTLERSRFVFQTDAGPIKTENVSIRCDSVLVFDFDVKDGVPDDYTLKYREAESVIKFLGINPLHRLFLQPTPSGGIHYVFLVPSTVKSLNKIKCFETDLFWVDVFLNTNEHLLCIYDPIINVMPVPLETDFINGRFFTEDTLRTIFTNADFTNGGRAYKITKKQREVFLSYVNSVSARVMGGNRYSFRCPCHDDKNPSAGAILGGHYLLLKCWAGCPSEDLFRAIVGENPAPKRIKDNKNGHTIPLEVKSSSKLTDLELVDEIKKILKDKYVYTR
ncbi:MAG: hypothetical protein ABIK73_07005 [candidate division WOR-3 bacterium]